MSAPILATKLYIPPARGNVVLRPRLIARLNEGLGHRLTLISAPAGFGKTTLVSEWVAAGERPAAWVSLDEGDSDPARFLTYIVAALRGVARPQRDAARSGGQGIAEDLGADALRALQSPGSPPLETVLTPLLNEIASFPHDFLLVLDDYHVVDSEEIDRALAFLIERLPPPMHLVIATREDPDLPLARFRARGQLTELRVQDMRFTTSEAADFLNRTMGLTLSTEEISKLEARTQGWIAGLQMAALSMQGMEDTSAFIETFTGSHRYVLDYLLEEVLHKQSEATQHFLQQTALLERICGPLCDAILPNASTAGRETLETLERANLFIVPLDHERLWYRYHPLFRDLLRQRFLHKSSPEEIARIHVRASEWLEANGDLAEAFHHALAAAEVDRAARLAESAWQAMNESFQMGAWLGWVNRLPSNAIRVRPVLCIQIGQAHMDLGNVDASEASLRDAEESLALPSSEMIVVEKAQFQTLPAQIAYARAYNAQSQHRFADAARYAEQALDLIPDEDDFLQVQVSTILSSTHWANGNLDAACKLIGAWVEASKRAGNIPFAVAGAFGKADIQIAQGRLRDALQTYQQALELAAAHNADQHTAHHHLGLGMLYHEMGEDERASQHLQRGFELGRRTTIVDWAYRTSLTQAHLKESEDDLDGALESLDEAQRAYIRTPTPIVRPVDAMKARIHLKQGRLLEAQGWADRSGLSLRDAPDYLHEFERLTMVQVALAGYQDHPDEERWADAFELLEGQLKLAEQQDRLRSQMEVLVAQALALHAKGELAKALGPLERALTLAEPEGFLRVFAAEGKPMAGMLLKLQDRRLDAYARRILALRRTQPGDPSAHTGPQPLAEPLSRRELEVLRLLAQGLSNQEIAQELFVALNTVKGHNLRIFSKLQAKSRSQAVARARELGLL